MDKKRDELNVVFFMLTDDIQTGLDTYVNLLISGLRRRKHNAHLINFIDDDFYLPKITLNKGSIIANIPMPTNKKGLLANENWQNSFFSQVFQMLSGFFTKKTNLIWHPQVLLLTRLASIFKNNLRGTIVSHVHIIHWKFLYDSNEFLFSHPLRST